MQCCKNKNFHLHSNQDMFSPKTRHRNNHLLKFEHLLNFMRNTKITKSLRQFPSLLCDIYYAICQIYMFCSYFPHIFQLSKRASLKHDNNMEISGKSFPLLAIVVVCKATSLLISSYSPPLYLFISWVSVCLSGSGCAAQLTNDK